MIVNQNNLKFSQKNVKKKERNELLNQNPLIITKSEAFSFAYADPDKVKYAQLLAKRDVEALRETESINKIEIVPEVEIKMAKQARCQKGILRKFQVDERVKSVKRLPGPQTPSKIVDNRRKGAPSILKSQVMPTRSMSPPVRDTDTNWRPKDNALMERLQSQVNHCTNKLDQLERNMLTKRCSNLPVFTMKDFNHGKTERDLKVLEDKLRSIVGVKAEGRCKHSPTFRSSSQVLPPQQYPPQLYYPQSQPLHSRLPQPQSSYPIDQILDKLDSLSTEMDTIKSRWTTLPYETVSVIEDDQENDNHFRFTKQAEDLWKNNQIETVDDRVCLDVPRQVVARLDGDRRRFNDVNRFPILSKGVITPSRAGEWFSEDIVDEVIEDVIKEVDEVNGELVEELLKEEFSD